MALERWDPFRGFHTRHNLFDRMWRTWPVRDYRGENGARWHIPLDVVREDDDILVTATLPGIAPDDVKVTIEDNVLTIKTEANEEESGENGNYLMRERRTGAFHRALRLPDTVDVEKAESSYLNGVLTVRFPKLETKKAKQIEVKVS